MNLRALISPAYVIGVVLLVAIVGLGIHLDDRIGGLQWEIDRLESELDDAKSKIGELEDKVSDAEDEIETLKRFVAILRLR